MDPMNSPSFAAGRNADNNVNKVIFVMGATGTGKSRLSVAIASSLSGEIINSDKIQVYKGLDVVTNKIPDQEKQGVPHHLLGEVDPDLEYTADDFCDQARGAIEWIIKSGRVPVVVGGSNTYIGALLEDPSFKSTYDCCFIWLDVELPVLFSFVAKRVDQMVEAGLVDEVREMFDPEADYSKGIRRAIGVPEMDKYFRAEADPETDEATKNFLLVTAIEEIKENTCKLILRQLEKIHGLHRELDWAMRRIDATMVFEKLGSEEAVETWQKLVLEPSLQILKEFLGAEEVTIADVEQV